MRKMSDNGGYEAESYATAMALQRRRVTQVKSNFATNLFIDNFYLLAIGGKSKPEWRLFSKQYAQKCK